ncbi:MAG: hypothetical protein LBK76_03460 [Verrucomicrobiales bacterium]|jgi:hypothetical protein|nr:hypothetical protein [Verrucomicrobiales bacterium]
MTGVSQRLGGVRTMFKKNEVVSALRRYREHTGREATVSLRQIMQRVAIRLAIETQPFGNSKAAQRQSEGAIYKDLFGGKRWNVKFGGGRAGIFAPMNPAMLAATVEFYGDGNTVRLFVKKNGDVYGTDRALYRPAATLTEMAEQHVKYFRNGRMTAAGGATRDIGRWKFIDKMVVSQKGAKKYFTQVIARVGRAKGGWAACARLLGGTGGLLKFITRHPGEGEIVEVTGARPSLTIINRVPYVSAILSERQIQVALKIAQDWFVHYANAAARAAARRAGLKLIS